MNRTRIGDSLFSTMAFAQSQSAYLNQFDDWLMHSLDVDPDNLAYQNTRSHTNMTLNIGSLVIGGYGLIKGGIKVAKHSR